MSQLLGPRPKFLPSQWRHANHANFGSAEAERQHSERLSAECKRLIDESDKSALRLQQDANKRLEQRLHDIKFWRQELEQELAEMVQEIEVLLIFKCRVERALESCSEPLKVTMQCLAERQNRVGIDLVHDEAEQELMKEREVIEGVSALLQKTLEQTTEQIRLNRSAKYNLEKDLRDKYQAEQIDDFCAILTNASSSLDGLANTADLTKAGGAVTPEEWETFSNVNIVKAESEKNKSMSVRVLVESMLEQTAADMRRQHEAAGSALERCIQNTQMAKAQLEEHLSKLLAEIASQEQNLEALRVAIADKDGPLNVVRTRLASRSKRPSMELCHDPAQVRLLSEIQELTGHVNRLKEAHVQAEMEMRALTRTQLDLEEDIQVKSHSLYIDEVICKQLHQPIKFHNF